jgi:hypothetical protein
MDLRMKIVTIWKTSFGFYKSKKSCKKRKIYDHYYGKKILETPKKVFAILDEEENYHLVKTEVSVAVK